MKLSEKIRRIILIKKYLKLKNNFLLRNIEFKKALLKTFWKIASLKSSFYEFMKNF